MIEKKIRQALKARCRQAIADLRRSHLSFILCSLRFYTFFFPSLETATACVADTLVFIFYFLFFVGQLLKSNTDENVINALAQLKIAFDNAEKAQPGITHTMIAQIIETLKR